MPVESALCRYALRVKWPFECRIDACGRGLETGNVPPAVLWAVDKGKNGKRTELVEGQLSQPGGVVVVNNVVYVTDNIFFGGRLSKIN